MNNSYCLWDIVVMGRIASIEEMCVDTQSILRLSFSVKHAPDPSEQLAVSEFA